MQYKNRKFVKILMVSITSFFVSFSKIIVFAQCHHSAGGSSNDYSKTIYNYHIR